MKLIPKPLRRTAERFLAEEAGRLLYGNLLGPKNNRTGRRRLKEAQRRTGPVPEVAAADEMRRDGCMPYAGIDPGRLASVRDQYFTAIEDPDRTDRIGAQKHRRAKTGEPVYRIAIQDAARTLPAAIGLLDAEVQRLIVSYYRANFRLLSVMAWRNFHVPGHILAQSEPFSLSWHVDYFRPDMLKLFVALDTIEDDDGPFHFVTSGRTAELIRRGYRNRYDYRGIAAALEDPAYVRRLVGPPGAAAFCNTTTNLHRAGIPAPGRRRDILQFRFEVSPTPFDPTAPLGPRKKLKAA